MGYNNISNNNTILFFDFNDYTNENKTKILLNLVNYLLGNNNYILTTFKYDNTTNNLTIFVNVSSDTVAYTTISLYNENNSLIEEYNTTDRVFTYSLSFPSSGTYDLVISSYDENGTLLSQTLKSLDVIIYNLYIDNISYDTYNNYFNVTVCSTISNVSSNVSLMLDGEVLDKKPIVFSSVECINTTFYLNDTTICGYDINITANVDPITNEINLKDNTKTIIKDFNNCDNVNFSEGIENYNAPENQIYILIVFIILIIYLETRKITKEKINGDKF